MSKRLGGIIGCKDKTSSWHFIGFLDGSTLPGFVGDGDSFLFIYFLPVLVFLYSIFVCDSASEFGAMGSTSFLGLSYPNLLLVFLNLVFLGTCIIFFSQVLGLFLWVFSYFIVIFLYLTLG